MGHGAIVHACTIEDDVLIGMGAKVLDGAVVKRSSIVAAGSMVAPGTTIPSGEVCPSPVPAPSPMTGRHWLGARCEPDACTID